VIGLVAGQARIAAAIDWQNCVICQKHTPSQSLVCPALGKKRQTGDGYKSLEDDLLGFQSIGCLPQTINMDSLNEGSSISNTLKTNFARWHKSYRDNISSNRLDTAKKRKLNEEVAESANQTYRVGGTWKLSRNFKSFRKVSKPIFPGNFKKNAFKKNVYYFCCPSPTVNCLLGFEFDTACSMSSDIFHCVSVTDREAERTINDKYKD
jgi:hypothetical protein